MDKPYYCPVQFDPPPGQAKSIVIQQGEPAFIKPTFCSVAESYDLPVETSMPPFPNYPSPSFSAVMYAPQNAPIQASLPRASLPSPQEPVSSVPHQAKVKAYDTAQDLMQSLPMLIVNEGLYFFDGQIYHLATADEMKREIIRHCRHKVQLNGSIQLVKEVYDFIRSEPNIVHNELLDGQRFLAFENGLLDLHTGVLGPFDPRYFVTARISSLYRPDLTNQCPHFTAFLTDISCGDAVLICRIWECLGYCLSPDTSGKVFFLAQGVPNSGKSVLGRFLSDCFDKDAVTALNINDMGQRFSTSELLGKRLSLCMDLPATPWKAPAVAVLKELTGNDLISADVKYCPQVKFLCSAKFLFGSNHAVTLTTRDDAFMRRLVVIPFRKSVPPEQQDRTLREKFNAERDAIVATALAYYFNLRKRGYHFSGDYPLNSVVAKQRSTETCSWEQAIPEFFFQQCELDQDSIAFTEDLYQRFIAIYPELNHAATFSAKFMALLDREFPGKIKKARKRQSTGRNAQYLFKGIRLLNL